MILRSIHLSNLYILIKNCFCHSDNVAGCNEALVILLANYSLNYILTLFYILCMILILILHLRFLLLLDDNLSILG